MPAIFRLVARTFQETIRGRTSAAATPKSSMSSAGDKAPSTNKGKTTIWSASAMMTSTRAARKRGPGVIVMVSSVTAGQLALLNLYSRPMLRRRHMKRHYGASLLHYEKSRFCIWASSTGAEHSALMHLARRRRARRTHSLHVLIPGRSMHGLRSSVRWVRANALGAHLRSLRFATSSHIPARCSYSPLGSRPAYSVRTGRQRGERSCSVPE